MRLHKRSALGFILGIVFISMSGVASAAPITIEMVGSVLTDGNPTPTPIALTLTIDDARADEDPASGAYLATDHGDIVADITSPATGTAARIETDSLAGTWRLQATLASVLNVPIEILFTGTGLTPDQIVPDFSFISSGVFTSNIGPIGVSGWVTIVPEPSTALLFGAGLALVAARRRRGSTAHQ